jgi:hypothetical protein
MEKKKYVLVGAILCEKVNTIRFKPFKHMEAQEISVQSKPPKSFKFDYMIDRAFNCVTGMVVDKDDNLILADEYFQKKKYVLVGAILCEKVKLL